MNGKSIARIYACGGAGVNIGSLLEEFRNRPEVGVANIDVSYIDTSRSNLGKNIPDEHCFIFEGVDGSGSIRSENFKVISENVLKILKKFEPGNINIVVSSTGGGSGSVIAPSIVSQLLEEDQQVIVIQIGDSDSKIRINNTIKAIKSYDAVSAKREKPVVVSYFENSHDTPRSKVDETVRNVIIALTAVFSKENRELDTRDLYNFLNFHRVTSCKPQIAELSVVSQEDLSDFSESAVTIASIVSDENQTKIAITPEYRCVGFVSKETTSEFQSSLPIHLVVTVGGFSDMIKQMEDNVKQIDKDQQSRKPQSRIVGSGDDQEENGLIL